MFACRCTFATHRWLSAYSPSPRNAAPDQGLPPMVRCNLCLPIEMCSHPIPIFSFSQALPMRLGVSGHAGLPTHCTASGWLPSLGLAAQCWRAVPPTSGIDRSGRCDHPVLSWGRFQLPGARSPLYSRWDVAACTLSFPAHRSAAAPSRLRSIGSPAGKSHPGHDVTAAFACSGLHSSPGQRRACRRASNELAERASAADITALAPVSPRSSSLHCRHARVGRAVLLLGAAL